MKEEETPKGYNLFRRLGNGTFGKVFLTVKETNPELLATKVINISNEKDSKMLDYLKKEKEILKLLNHPNIIKLDDFIEYKNHYFFIMEYCNGGTLLEILNKYLKK